MDFRKARTAILLATGTTASAVLGTVSAWLGLWGAVTLNAVIVVCMTVLIWKALLRDLPVAPVQGLIQDTFAELTSLRAILDQAPAPMLTVDSSVRIHTLNRAARHLFATDALVLPAPEELLGNAVRFRYGTRTWRIDRASVNVLGQSKTIVTLIDIEPEEHAAEARATRQLLDVLGHEVLNGLAPIASLAESAHSLLHAGDASNPLLQETLATLARRADSLHRFSRAYRELARLPEPSLSQTDIRSLVNDLVIAFDSYWQSKVEIIADLPELSEAMVDPDQIAQALWALMQNGAEAALQGVDPPTLKIRAEATKKELSIFVCDSGNGIPVDLREAIFRPFFTTKEKGTGIGLGLATQIARSHGGRLELMSSPDTTFRIALPTSRRDAIPGS